MSSPRARFNPLSLIDQKGDSGDESDEGADEFTPLSPMTPYTPSAGTHLAQVATAALKKHKREVAAEMDQFISACMREGFAENKFDSYDQMPLRYLAMEFVGTFTLTLVACGSVLSSGAPTGQMNYDELTISRLLSISLAIGFMYASLLYASQSFLLPTIVGKREPFNVGHFNPAITFACTLIRNPNTGHHVVSGVQAMLYMIVQCLASSLAAKSLEATLPSLAVSQLGATVLGEGVSGPRALLLEVILSFILVWVAIMLMVRDEESHEQGLVNQISPFVLGLLLVACTMVGGPISGASMNPARSFGPALISGCYISHWIYWVGPFLGAGLAAGAFSLYGKHDSALSHLTDDDGM